MTTPIQINANESKTVAAHIAAGLDDLVGAPTLRSDSLARFSASCLPNRRVEAWKYTQLNTLAKTPFHPVIHAPKAKTIPAFDKSFLPDDIAALLVFVDGHLREDLCDLSNMAVSGLALTTLGAALNTDSQKLESHISAGAGIADSLMDLNAAFMTDGAVITLGDGIIVEKPIVIVSHASTPGAAVHMRNVITLGHGAQASIIEINGPAIGESFTNTVSDITLGKNASLIHGRIQNEAALAIHLNRAKVALEERAEYSSFAFASGAALSRQETDVAFNGSGGTARLYGITLGRDGQHIDHTTRVHHGQPDCATEELFKSVLDDHAHGVFQGRIHVAPYAIGTDARQKTQTLLLSGRAVADAKPELEILADDVQCAHGATVGDLDRDALFYMAARGIPPKQARDLLIAGFIEDAIDRFGAINANAATLSTLLRRHFQHWRDTLGDKDNG